MNRAARRSFVHRVRDAARVLMRGYEGGAIGTRWPRAADMRSPMTEGLNAGPTLASRAAYLVANDPYVAAIANAYRNDLVGPDGPTLQHPDTAIVTAWNGRFWSNCDAEGIATLGHLLARVVACWLVYGEAVIVMRTDPETGALKLLLTSPSQIDATRNEDLGDAGWIISGVHVARDGRRRGYYILPTPPDHPFATATATDAIRIDAADVLHVFDPQFPGAVRGISPLAPIITRAIEIDQNEDAQLVLQKVAALLSVFLTDPTGSMTLGDVTTGSKPEVSLEPGTVRFTPPDVTVSTVTPPKVDGATDFTKAMIRSLAAGVGLPAWMVSHDLSDVNYSSARLGALDWRRRAQGLQRSLLVGQLLNKVFRRFVALETIAGRLDVDLDQLAEPEWLFPGWPPIDVWKETQGDVLAVSAGLASRSEIIARRGRDPQQVDQEISSGVRPLPSAPTIIPEGVHANA
jgi:lambda family phage portal protein